MAEGAERKECARASETAVIIGLIGAVGSAVTGLTDWSDTGGRARRVGMMHGLLNAGATALYGASLFMPALAWLIMQRVIIHSQGEDSPLQAFLGRDFKGTLSTILYATGIGLSFIAPGAALICYAIVASIWLIPERRIEKMVAKG